MHIQRFTAKTMTEAMKVITAELGEDAVMLANRRIEGENGEDLLEVTAAVDVPLKENSTTQKELPKKAFETIPDNFPELERDASPLQKLLDKHGVLPNISKKIDNAVSALSDAGFDDLGTLDLILSKMIPFESPAKTLSKGKTHIFIGPTGAGKSSTLCKLAASKKMDRHTVGITTMDNQKMGGFEQMEIFAKALSEKAILVRAEEDWLNERQKFEKTDYVFIDTPGINAFNAEQVNNLKQRIDALDIKNKSVHLVLPATLNPLEMAAIPAAVASLHPESILFTKFDETTYLGGLTNVAITSGLKVCFVTDGTNIPHDIVELDASMLAEKLMRKPRLPWEREV